MTTPERDATMPSGVLPLAAALDAANAPAPAPTTAQLRRRARCLRAIRRRR